MAFFTPTLVKFYKLINTLAITEGSLKESLRQNVASFEQFLKYYIKINTIFAFIAILGIYCIQRYYPNKSIIFAIFSDNWIILTVQIVIGCLIIVPTTKWYINSLYGGYAKKLRQLLTELEE